MKSNDIRYYEFGEYRLDLRKRVLTRRGSPVALTNRNFELLLVLVENQGRILSHDELLEKVWEGQFVEQSNLKKGIWVLRNALEESASESEFIRTIPRKGYSFIAHVNALPDDKPTVIFQEEELVIEEIVEEDFDEDFPAREKTLAAKPASVFWNKGKILFLSVAILVAMISAALFWQSRKSTALSGLKLENLRLQKLSTGDNIVTAAISPDGKTVVYATLEPDGKQTLRERSLTNGQDIELVTPAQIRYSSIVVAPDNGSVYYTASSGGNWYELFRISILGGAAEKILENLSSAATFSPDGKRMAFAYDKTGGERLLLTADLDGENKREIYAVADAHLLINPRWSPKGDKIVFISSEIAEKGRVWALSEISVNGGAVRRFSDFNLQKIYNLAWLGDGSGLIVTADIPGTKQVQLWSVSYPNGNIERLTNDVLSYEWISLNAENNKFLTVNQDVAIDLWSAESGKPETARRLTTSRNFWGAISVLPDNRILAETIENGQRKPRLYNPDGSQREPVQLDGTDRHLSASPDGKTIVFTSPRSGTEQIWRSDIDGRNPRQLTEEGNFVALPQISPDGRWVYFLRTEGIISRLCRIPLAGGKTTQVTKEAVWVFTLSQDGELLAYSFFDEGKKRWQVAVERLSDHARIKQFDIAPGTFLLWTSDGKNLLYNASDIFREGGNLWLQPLEGGSPKLLIDAQPEKIYWADTSSDGKIYFTKGNSLATMVLLTRNSNLLE